MDKVLWCAMISTSKAPLVVLLLSGFVNVVLIIGIFVNTFRFRNVAGACPDYSLKIMVMEEERLGVSSYPKEASAFLSHVVIMLHESSTELSQVFKQLSYWKKYPPCLHNGYPTSWSKAHVTLTIYLDKVPSKKFAETIVNIYEDLPPSVRCCFSSMEIRQAGVGTPTILPIGALEQETHERLSGTERDFYTRFITNQMGLLDPSHVLLLTPDCIPIQANWLNLMDYQTRIPIERFWIKGSLFRGDEKIPHIPRDLIALNRVAIYNFSDESLGIFYSEVVRPFLAERLPKEDSLKPVEYDWPAYFFSDFQHYNWTRMMVSLFRLTDVIQDLTDCNIDLAKLQHDSPDTLIVKGVAPDMETDHIPSEYL